MKRIIRWHRFRAATRLSAGLAAFFFVPYLVGSPSPISESGMYGYSNRAALLILGIVLLASVVWQRGFGLTFPERSPERCPAQAAGLSRSLLWVTALLSAGLATFVWLMARPGIAFQEAPYFLDRYAMYGLGQRLYRDIDYSYGPLMFYLPITLARITRLSMEDSFFVMWILQWFVGVAALWKVIDIAMRGTGLPQGRTIYLLLWVAVVMDVFAAGPNYCPLRYASGPLLAMYSWRLFATRKTAIPSSLCAALGSVALLLYSPEQGLALAFASIVFFVLNVRRRRGFLLAAAMFVAILSAGLIWAGRLGELAMMRAVSSGALNIPIFLSAQNLAFLFVLFVTASASWNAVRMHRTDDPMLYIALVSLACVPAAFGQANPGHMFYNLLGAIIVALIVLANDAPASRIPSWRLTKIGFVLVFILATGAEHVFMDHAAITIPARHWIVASGNRDSMFRRIYIALMGSAVGKAEMQARLAQLDADAISAAKHQPDLFSLAPGTMVIAPFGIDRPAHLEVAALRIFTGRYPWLLPMLNANVTSDKIAELKAHPDLPLLIPDVSDGSECRYDPQQLRQHTWQNFLPLYIPAIRHPMTSAEPLCTHINANYRRATIPKMGQPSIWLPIDHIPDPTVPFERRVNSNP